MKSLPPSLPQPPVPRPAPQGAPEALPSPILRGRSRPLWAALRRAPGRSGGCDRAALGARAEVWGGVAAGGGRWGPREVRCRGTGAKSALNFLSATSYVEQTCSLPSPCVSLPQGGCLISRQRWEKVSGQPLRWSACVAASGRCGDRGRLSLAHLSPLVPRPLSGMGQLREI